MTEDNRNYVILTGAGFSRDFGGLLAKDMWGVIYNSLESSGTQVGHLQCIKKYMFKKGHDQYEAIYTDIKNKSEKCDCGNTFTDEDFASYRNAVEKAYTILHECEKQNWPHHYDNQYISETNRRLSKLVKWFLEQECTYLFTLNQDLLIERALIKNEFRWPNTNVEISDQTNGIEIQDIDDEGDLRYFKLHGSLNWRDQNGELLILFGKEKLHLINEWSIFSRYHNKFSEALKNSKVLSIGYSFNDEHINQNIMNSIEEIELHVMDPLPPSQFFEVMSLQPDSSKAKILSKIHAYYPWSYGEYLTNEELQRLIHKSYFGEDFVIDSKLDENHL
ncbi:MAG: SIR2 family protein [Gammaproteobacteria bacterium]